ncbi:unnamed protein product [Porites lobata]|uniref:Uncharacterized protein n=1 Tax=Porites lobata TaxID=104759 RepID=A0ABN8NL64_9CNID|nr:unnamed protein product [Porites lobata]
MGSQSQSDSSQLTSLIKLFTEAGDIQEKLEHFTSLTSQVLPCLTLVEVEAKLFSRILPKVYDAVSDAVSQIEAVVRSHLGDAERDSSFHSSRSLLQLVLSFMACLESCIGHMSQLSLTDELCMSHLHSLPSAVIQTVKTAFKHCKDSENIYGELFQLVSQDLATLFKKTYQLQKALMELLDRIQFSYNVCDQDVKDITEVCHQLLEICTLIGDLDTSILVNTWKALKRLLVKHKEHIKNHLEVDRLICHLCISIEAKLERCIHIAPVVSEKVERDNSHKGASIHVVADEAAFGKMLKVMRFLVGHLVHLVKEFDGYYDKCIENVFQFLLIIQSKLPPSLSAPKIAASAAEGVKSALLVVIEPLLAVLVTNKKFAILVTKESTEIDETLQFSQCCLLASILSILPKTTEDVFQYWVMPTNYPEEENRLSVMEVVFKSFKLCVLEVCLPVFVDGIMSNGKALSQVKFYEHVCARLCALVASAPVACFPTLERCLLEKVLEDDLLCALLASDVWCFMARWGSAELCAGHVTVLTQLLLKLPQTETAHFHLSLLIQRLVRLMAVEHQEALVSSFPPSKEENIRAWCAFPIQDMPEVVKKKICRTLVPLCIKVGHSRTTTHQPVKDDVLCDCLCCLERVYGLAEVEQYVPPVHQSAVIELVNSLWSLSNQGKENSGHLDIKTRCKLLDLSSILLHIIQPEDYAKILSGLKTLLSQCPSLELREAAAQFLGKCGSKEIPELYEAAVLGDITGMFSCLVSDDHWLVHQKAFQSVKAFAEVTRYTHVMGDCVPESLLPALSDFLNELPFRHNYFPADAESDKEFLKHQLDEAGAGESQSPDSGALDEKEIPILDNSGRSRDARTKESTGEPEAKRFKIHEGPSSFKNQGERLYEEALTKMKIPLSTILDLRKQFIPSPKVTKQIEEIQRVLQEFVNNSTE